MQRSTMNKWDLLNMKSLYMARDILNNTKCQSSEWEDIFTNTLFDRGLITKIYKELKKLDIKIANDTITNGVIW